MPGAQLQEVEGDEYRGIVKIKVGPITAQYKGVARIIEAADEAARRIVLKGEGRDTRGQGNASATVTADLLVASGGEGTDVKIEHRPPGHRQGGAVRPGRDGRRVGQAARSVRRSASSRRADRTRRCRRRPRGAGQRPRHARRPEAPVTGATATTATAAPRRPPSPAPAASRSASPERPRRRPPVRPPTQSPRRSRPGPRTQATTGVRKIESRPAEPIDLMAAAGGSVAKRLVPVLAAVVCRARGRDLRRRAIRSRHPSGHGPRP